MKKCLLNISKFVKLSFLHNKSPLHKSLLQWEVAGSSRVTIKKKEEIIMFTFLSKIVFVER